ncbi:MAG: hypothetical protein JXK07_07030 [Spirochaetes bacterium]|nr:hypothetical protein [Spirochaetota bacterium]MBN2770614.1 hypothetical protein [Spirochaetota bacterium]
MSISQRKQQFIKKIVELYSNSGLPIHYTSLAQEIGVSKWSSYEMLIELEKLGFIERQYQNNRNKSGRSRTIFSPTEKALTLFETLSGGQDMPVDEKVWNNKMSLLKRELDELKALPVGQSINSVIGKIETEEVKLFKIAYMFFIYLIIAFKSGTCISKEIIEIIRSVSSPVSQYMMLSGATLENLLENNIVDSPEVMLPLVKRSINNISSIPSADLKKLIEFFLNII